MEIIGSNSFGESNFQNIEFLNHSRLKQIGDYIFFKCQQLKFIRIPSSVESIRDFCFHGSSIEYLELENNSQCKTLGKYTFWECQYLKMILIPSNVEIIGYSCFYFEHNSNFVFYNGLLMDKNKTFLFFLCFGAPKLF